jgi:hypothetical protein
MKRHPELTYTEAERCALSVRGAPPFHDLTDAEVIYGVQCWAGLDLWHGRHVGDHSRADLKLCDELARWCGPDPERIDRLFRESGLMREKWERVDYRERTIDRACNRESFVGWDEVVPRGVRSRRPATV